MSRFAGIAFVLAVVVLAMAFAAANAGNQATLSLGLLTLYRVPVTLVAFSGLLVGMLVMFATGVHSDLKVRRILRERLAEETRTEQGWIDRNQRDLFGEDPAEDNRIDTGGAAALAAPPPAMAAPRGLSPLQGAGSRVGSEPSTDATGSEPGAGSDSGAAGIPAFDPSAPSEEEPKTE